MAIGSACNALTPHFWGNECRKSVPGRFRASAAASYNSDYSPESAIPVGLTFKFEVEELPASSSPFHRRFGDKKEQATKAEIAVPAEGNSGLDRPPQLAKGDINQFLIVSAGMLFLYWLTNFVFPHFVFKDTVFAKKEESPEEAAAAAAAAASEAVRIEEESNFSSKRYRSFKKSRKNRPTTDDLPRGLEVSN